MNKTLGTAELQIDEQNRQIIKSLIERNKIIEENNLPTDNMIPGYKLDSNGKFLSVNIKMAELLGYSSTDELMSAIVEKRYFILKSDLTTTLENSDYVIDKPLYLRTRSDSYLTLKKSVIKLKEDGRIRYYGLVTRMDSHKNVVHEDAIFWNAVKQMYGGMKSGIVICDSDGYILYENPAIRHLLGYDDLAELPSPHITGYVTEGCQKKMKESLGELFDKQVQIPSITYSLIKNDGNTIEVEIYSSMIAIEDRKLCLSVISGFGKDENMRNMESSVQYRKTLNLLSEIYILVTESGGICDLNESAVNLWGWNYNRYLTKSIFELGSFRVTDSKRRLDYLCDDGASRYTFVAKETIYGELLLSARMHSVVVNDKRCIAVVMESRHEIQQIKEKLEQEYHNNFVMFENSVCGIIHLNGKEIINANTQAYSLLKISYDIRGEQFSSIFPDTRRKKRHIVTTSANRMEEVFNYEFSTKGKRTLLEVHLFDVDKENTFCYFIDTTQHKSAPLSLANLSSRYRAIVEQSPCGVLIGDKNGDIIDVSGRFCEMIRMPAVEILGKNISALFTESSIKVKPLDYVRVDAGEIISAERELKCGDGTIKIVEMYSSVISTDMYQAVVLDITPRKIYENQMLDYRRQVHDMDMEKAHFLKMSKDITAIFTADANIKDIFVGESSPFYRYFNSEKEFIERFLSYISRKDYDMMLKQGIANAIAGNENKEQKVEIVIGGTLLILEVRFMLIENDVLVVISDVTERERIITELNRALKKSEENEKLQAAFLSNLSHEIRTPMNGVIGFADILLEGEDNPQKQEYLRIILNSSYQLLSVLSDIIEMSKLEAGVVQAKSEIVSVKKIIGDVCALMRTEHSVTDNNVQIMNLAQEHKETHIISDSTKLKQIITNLISNAIKFTKNGKVEVDFSETDEKVCITVRDNGVGISKLDIDHIFDRFFQTNNAKAATKGAGLGLAIVKSYVDMLQGTIRVESEEGKGSCFYVELPNNY